MNYDFLQNYNIPYVRENADHRYISSSHSRMEGAYGSYSLQPTRNAPDGRSSYCRYGDCNRYTCGYESCAATTGNSYDYQNKERFLPPAKQGIDYKSHKTPFKRKYTAAGGGGAPKKEAPIAEVTSDGKLVIFLGRDESYPTELNSLIHPLSCDLCNVKMNSRVIAKDHYESKAHDKHISSWLFKNYTEKGVSPPDIKRFIKQGSTGPDAYYCESCDLKLTSLTHANQHYAGKKHRLVIAQRSKPSGAGFYNSEGKWVRTGTKVAPKSTSNLRFGIGESFRLAEVLTATGNIQTVENQPTAPSYTITSAADTTTANEGDVNSSAANTTTKLLQISSDQDPTLFCSICKVSVTSAVQMTMHLSGSKHMKKLKLAGLSAPDICNNVEIQKDAVSATVMDNVLFSAIKEEIKPDPTDYSVYRTPSGQYYCKTCNTSMSHLPGLEQHLKGKRHLKKQAEEKAMASLAAKKK